MHHTTKTTSGAMTTPATLVDLEEEEATPATPIQSPAKRRLGLGGHPLFYLKRVLIQYTSIIVNCRLYFCIWEEDVLLRCTAFCDGGCTLDRRLRVVRGVLSLLSGRGSSGGSTGNHNGGPCGSSLEVINIGGSSLEELRTVLRTKA